MEDLPPLGALGRRLGRYELLQRIAVGGMAEVYRAYAAGPGDFRKLVAIKRLLPQHALDPQLLRMFLDESRLMARFGHPNLPQVIDVSDGGGVDVPFFVMEHVAGVDLREILRAAGGALPIEQIVAIATGVAAGLHHAHELRADDGRPLEIVHRDVSPSNVLVSFDGSVKVTDFGVAKWLQQKSFTYQGQLKGKFAHMSPEQCRGEPLDRRSDVFALGTLLYEMACGHPPFEAETELELLSKIASEDAPAPQTPKGPLAPAFVAIIMRALRRDRDERFATAQAIQLAIEAWARDERLVVSPVGMASYVESLFAARVAEWRSMPSGAEDHAPVAAREAVDRTATDAFALGNTVVSADRTIASPPPKPARVPVRPYTRRRRALGIAVAGVALLLALSIYELSRLAATAPTTAATSVPASTSATATAPASGTAPAAGVTIARPSATAAEATSARAPAAPAPTTIAASPPPATGSASTAPVAAASDHPAERRADPGAASPARRDPAMARARRSRRAGDEAARVALGSSAPASENPSRDEPARARSAPTTTIAAAAGTASAPTPTPTPEKPSPTSTPRPPQPKIWDPDSPVPP